MIYGDSAFVPFLTEGLFSLILIEKSGTGYCFVYKKNQIKDGHGGCGGGGVCS